MRGQHVKNRRDENEPAIVSRLQAHGLSVVRTDKPVDLLIGFRGCTYIAEVKTEKGKLTASQRKFQAAWGGNWTILRTEQDADTFARKIKGL